MGGYVSEDKKWQVVQHLLQWKQYGIPIDDGRILELVEVQVTETLLERLEALQVTERVFIAATGNHLSGQDLTEMLLRHCDKDAQITQDVIKSAASNSEKTKTLIPLLLSYQRMEVVLDKVTDEAWATLASFISNHLSLKKEGTEITIILNSEDKDTKEERKGEIDPKMVESGAEADEETMAFIRAFSKINQITALRTILSAADPRILFPTPRELYRASFDTQNWEHLEDIFQIIPPSIEDIISTLVDILMSDDKRAASRLLKIARRGNIGPGKENIVTKEVVSGCSKLIETQTPAELSRFLDYVYHLQVSFTRQHKADALPTQSAILPAAVSRDQSFMEILVQRHIVSVRMRPFTISRSARQIEKLLTEQQTDRVYGEERFLFEGMPDWPLYCAIVFTFDPRAIAFLCRAGARINADSDILEQQRKPAIISKLEYIPMVRDVRRDYMKLYDMCNTLAKAALNPQSEELSDRGLGAYQYYFHHGVKWDKSFAQAWDSMDGVLGSDADELVHWEGNEWPLALSSEDEWESWRKEVLDILRPFWEYHYPSNPL
ncbi:hypothetical protein QWA68_014683 [Fusarium oxysporum]|nr:hypothetical protein QWA68_014683 [Fusarium oxysporum]